MNRGLKIIATGRALPKKVLTNDDLSQMVETDDEWIVSRTGIKERRICEDEDEITLAIEAARKALQKAKEQAPSFTVEDIGLLLVATTTEEQLFPSTACMVQKALSLPVEMLAFDLTAACSGFLFGMQVAHSMLNTGTKKYALVVGSEHLSRIVDYTDRTTCILFGDGAGAAVFSLAEEGAVGFYQNHFVDGDAQALSCQAGGYMKMDGQAVFRFATKALHEAVEHLLTKSGLTMDDIDHVVCHQANKRIIDYVKRKYPGHEEKFFMNLEHYGNTSSASIPIALSEMCEQAGKPGDKVLCVGFGAGLTWGSALITL